jgi:hypothetical protein
MTDLDQSTITPPPAPGEVSDKGFVPAVLLCFFLGSFGVHRFYLGKVGTGLLMLVTFGGLGICSMGDKQGRPLSR